MKYWIYAGLGLILCTALALASVGAYMSIVGLATLFSAHMMTIIILAIIVEWTKILIAGANHMFWKVTPWWKYLLAGAVISHMIITNMGIYGYISDGYLKQTRPEAQIELKIDQIDKEITHQEGVIARAQPQIDALDEAERRYIAINYIRVAQEYREKNAPRRAKLEQSIADASDQIAVLEKKKTEALETKEEAEAQLGSLKHLSHYFSDDVLTAVTYFIILIMMGLDPVAVMLVVFFAFLLRRALGINFSDIMPEAEPKKIIVKVKQKPEVIIVEEEPSEQELEFMRRKGFAPVFSKGHGDVTQKKKKAPKK